MYVVCIVHTFCSVLLISYCACTGTLCILLLLRVTVLGSILYIALWHLFGLASVLVGE
jgi:hypothetical protein